MNRIVLFAAAVILMTLEIKCKSFSKYRIDEKPEIKIDSSLFGIWKAVEDTDKANYILVQSHSDIVAGTGSTDSSFYNTYFYYFTYMSRHGTNRRYEKFNAFLSKVENVNFLNIVYSYTPHVGGEFKIEQTEEGYLFVRLIYLNHTKDSLITTIVADTTLKYLAGTDMVRKQIRDKLNAPAFYADTMHFYKVSNYHSSLNGSKIEANR